MSRPPSCHLRQSRQPGPRDRLGATVWEGPSAETAHRSTSPRDPPTAWWSSAGPDGRLPRFPPPGMPSLLLSDGRLLATLGHRHTVFCRV